MAAALPEAQASTTNPNSSSNVTAAKPKAIGCLFYAPLGTPVPENGTDPLDKGFANLGYLSKDGFEDSLKEDNATIQAFGGDTVLVTRTSTEETFNYTLIEALRIDVLKQVYGQNQVTGKLDSTGIKVVHNSQERPHGIYVFEVVLREDVIKRIVIPNAQVTAVDSISYKDDEAIGYKTTLTAYPYDADNRAIEYIVKTLKG